MKQPKTQRERDLEAYLALKPFTVQLSVRVRQELDLMLQSGLWGETFQQACEWIIAERVRAEIAAREGRKFAGR